MRDFRHATLSQYKFNQKFFLINEFFREYLYEILIIVA